MLCLDLRPPPANRCENRIYHAAISQIYISQINTLLALGCIALVIGFRKSEALASAYGIAVTLTMLATTLLLYFAARRMWKWSRIRAGALCVIPLAVEGAFFTGNTLKVLHGGWLPLAIGAVVFLQMTTWKKGRYLLRKNSRQMLSLTDLIISTTALEGSGLPCRVPGTAVFLSAQPKGAPASLLHNIRHNRVLHQPILCSQSSPTAYRTSKKTRALKLKISLTVFPESSLTWVSWKRRRSAMSYNPAL